MYNQFLTALKGHICKQETNFTETQKTRKNYEIFEDKLSIRVFIITRYTAKPMKSEMLFHHKRNPNRYYFYLFIVQNYPKDSN